MDNIFILIPTLDPNIEILDEFLDKLKKEFKNIMVFNDGSKKEFENYFKNLEKEGIIVKHHYINLGKGRAMKTAFNYLLTNYPDIEGVITADSDGQHSIKDIKKCAKEVLKRPDTLILGCRNFDLANVPKRNRFGNKLTAKALKFFVGLNVSDTQTGLRGLSKNLMVKFMDTVGERYEYETNQLIDTIDKKVNIKEIPIDTIYIDGNSESHFNPIKDSFIIYKIFFKYLMASVSSFAIDIILFAIFNRILNSTYNALIATIIARVLSSMYNYLVNSQLVFKRKNKTSFIKYALLVVVQMMISGLLVQTLSNLITINTVVLKVVIDLIIFLVNFIIQRELVFKGEENE